MSSTDGQGGELVCEVVRVARGFEFSIPSDLAIMSDSFGRGNQRQNFSYGLFSNTGQFI